MTWENRLRLTLGVLGVIALVAALTVVFNQRQNQITSFTGAVAADLYLVGADHSGTVISQDVEVGDTVEPGDPLFTVQSLQLKEAIAAGVAVSDTEAYHVDPVAGTIAYRAVVTGQVTDLTARLGNSVPAGGGLATITASGNRYVTASFRLVPRDYARIAIGAPARITLAGDQIIDGTVAAITAETSDSGTVSRLRISSDALADAPSSLTNPGAPVTVSVDLPDSGPLAGVGDLTTDFLTKIGLR